MYPFGVKYLRDSIEVDKGIECWIYERNDISEQRYIQVDWETTKLAMKGSPVARRQHVTKLDYSMGGGGK